jgi:hypothetical protein
MRSEAQRRSRVAHQCGNSQAHLGILNKPPLTLSVRASDDERWQKATGRAGQWNHPAWFAVRTA